MKPLLTAPLTDEDWAILVNHRGDFRRGYLMGWLLGHGLESDRRDAALMLKLTKRQQFERATREEFGVYMPGPAAVAMVNGCEL